MPFFTTQTEYAEDQHYAKPILGLHVMDRGFQVGTFIGLDVALALGAYQRFKQSRAVASSSVTAATATATAVRQSITVPTFVQMTTRFSGIGALAGATIFTLGLPLYMRGKSTIEWQDRAWRLLGNPGQVEVDKWSTLGEVVGVGSAFVPALSSATNRNFFHIVGRGSLGGLAGVMGYMVWRYGIRGGHKTSTTTEKVHDEVSDPGKRQITQVA